MSPAIVLDTLALLAMLKNEPGAERVSDVIANAQIAAVNYAEVVGHFIHVGVPAAEVDAILRPYP